MVGGMRGRVNERGWRYQHRVVNGHAKGIVPLPPFSFHFLSSPTAVYFTEHAGSRVKLAVKVAPKASADAKKQLNGFIEKFEPKNQALIRAVRKELRKRLPTANELVYDNYNFFVVGYCSTERPSDAILSIAAGANGVGLCFIHGARLPDPKKILLGSGKQTRFIRIGSADMLSRPEVEALIKVAIAQAKAPLPASAGGKLIIRSISAKQRPRR